MKSRFFLTQFLVCLLPFAIMTTATAQTSNPAPVSYGPASQPSLAAAYGRLPLSFEPNRGQTDSRVKFLSRGNRYSLFLTDSSAVLALSMDEPSSSNRLNPSGLSQKTPLSGAKSFKTDVIRMELAGARPNLRVTGAEQLQGTANYFIGQNPAKWHASVPTFAKVRYEDVYPGIDLVYYGNQRQLEYDFILAPHADPKPLRLHFAGAHRLRLTPGGDLAIVAKNGEIAFHKPAVYQLRNGLREAVEGRFQILARNNIGFRLGSYDHARTLVIDPALAYSTYLGGTGGDTGNAIAVDSAGDAYVVGGTQSADFPVTSGALQKVNNGKHFNNGFYLNNVFITKFNSKGSALVYSTYLGGTTQDEAPGTYAGDVATGIAIDAAGDAYVTGYTSAYNFPVTSNAYQKVNKASMPGGSGEVGNNAFASKLNPTGSALIYSTYFGGSGGFSENGNEFYGETPAGIAIDAAGNAYVAGSTGSPDLPITSNAFQKVNNAGSGAFNFFITKFNSTGSGLIYSTYLGGSGVDDGREINADTAGGITIDPAGDAYVTGTAYSRDFPVTANAYQKVNRSFYTPKYGAAGTNGVITELNPTGSALVYSTYLGGSYWDGGRSIALDAPGNAYVTGFTQSPDFPTTPGVFQKMIGSGGGSGANAFVTKFNPNGSALIYSTFLGGSRFDSANGIALDAFGSAYVTGDATSLNFPVTPDAFRKVNHAPNANGAYTGNAFVSKLDPTGSMLIYSSYLGGSAGIVVDYGDTGNGIAVDAFGNAYLTGTTCSSDFPLAGASFQAVNKGAGCTAFFSKFIVNKVTETSVVSDSNPQKTGVAVTFTADVVANTGSSIPTGSVVFSIEGKVEATVPLDDTGHAIYSNSALGAGRYTITAMYLGSATDSGSSASLGQTILGPPARITVSSGSYQTTTKGSPFALPLVVQVQDSNGRLVPGSVVTFSGSGLAFSSNPVVTGSNGQASVVATATATGALTATASVSGIHAATLQLTVNVVSVTGVDVTTYHYDNARDGLNANETMLTPSNVNATSFGKMGFYGTDGKVDGAPLYLSTVTLSGQTHNVLYVVTEHDSVFAFDADNGTQLWQVSVLGANETPSDDHSCGQITPEIGITSTPVIDRQYGGHGAIFVVGMTKDSGGSYHQRLHALDLTTGAELSGGPTEIQATYPGTGLFSNNSIQTFLPGQYAERVGLLLMNGTIYLGWTSHCDQNPYTGWLMAYSEQTLQQTSVLNLTPNCSSGSRFGEAEGSIWMSGAGLAGDASGNIYFLDANGGFDATLDANGFPNLGDYGNAFMKVGTAKGKLAVADYFTSSNIVAESDDDVDLGSGGVLLLPDQTDSAGQVRQLAVGAGKDESIYVVDRNDMGKLNSVSNSIYQQLPRALPHGEWGMPAWFNGRVYYGGQTDVLKAFDVVNARLQTTPSSQSSTVFAYPGTTPSVSANGTKNGIVWAVENSSGNGVLHAYDAANLSHELYNSNQATNGRDSFTDNKFITPVVANGKVYVGTTTGVAAFGLHTP